jgi:hypothetical protein
MDMQSADKSKHKVHFAQDNIIEPEEDDPEEANKLQEFLNTLKMSK